MNREQRRIVVQAIRVVGWAGIVVAILALITVIADKDDAAFLGVVAGAAVGFVAWVIARYIQAGGEQTPMA